MPHFADERTLTGVRPAAVASAHAQLAAVAKPELAYSGPADFTSAHVLAAVTGSLAGKQLNLVLDHPGKNPTADQTDPATVSDLRQALGQDFTQAWALTRTDPDATAWIYPTAYHIKVAVRDHAAFWLCSGNWNNSNQPDIDPVNVPADAARPPRSAGDQDRPAADPRPGRVRGAR